MGTGNTFDKDFSEKIGLVKFDFLGLKTLTVIKNAEAPVITPKKRSFFSYLKNWK